MCLCCVFLFESNTLEKKNIPLMDHVVESISTHSLVFLDGRMRSFFKNLLGFGGLLAPTSSEKMESFRSFCRDKVEKERKREREKERF